jgi:hypothetical protein
MSNLPPRRSGNPMSAKYKMLLQDAQLLLNEIAVLPAGLNTTAEQKAYSILNYSQQRIQTKIEIEFDVKEKHSRFTYSEMLSFIDLYCSKKVELEIAKAGLVKNAPPAPAPGKTISEPVKVFSSRLPGIK